MAISVLITDDLHPVFKQKMDQAGVHYDDMPKIKQEDVRGIIANYEAVIINSKITIDKAMLDRAHKLRFIGRAGSGMEIIDTIYAEQKGIYCSNTPEGNRDAVGEHTVGFMLDLLHNITNANSDVRQRLWKREQNRGEELREKTVGILGYGHMGSAVAEKLYGLCPRVIAYDKYKKNFSSLFVEEVDQKKFYEETEILSIHLPLTDETTWLVDRTYLTRFQNLQYVVNTARGTNLVTEDLVNMLMENRLHGAALDVIEEENPANFSKKFEENFNNLTKINKLVVTPHIAGWSNESRQKIAELLASRLLSTLF